MARRISALVAADEYGAREELLRGANLLLNEKALRRLVASYEAQLDAALGAARATRGAHELGRRRSGGSPLTLLSEALQDPNVLVRAVLKRSPASTTGPEGRCHGCKGLGRT